MRGPLLSIPAFRPAPEQEIFPFLEETSQRQNRWRVSFLLAGAAHLFMLFAGRYLLIQPPEFGMQGSSASMEIYMVAALPEVPAPAALFPVTSMEPSAPKSEMEIARMKPQDSPALEPRDEKAFKRSADQASGKLKAKGDGSSPEPGESVTTLFSRGASETAGKEGKYQNPPPQYPPLAEKRGLQGVVILRALIENEGKPSKVVVEKSSGHRMLDEAALSAVRDWEFTAGRLGGMTMASWIKIPIRFSLQEARV